MSIGIDLGTACSCVGVWSHSEGKVVIIKNGRNHPTMPSRVGFGNVAVYVGDDLLNTSAVIPDNYIYDAKRLIGKKFSDLQVQKDMQLWSFRVTEGDDDTPKICVTRNGKKEQYSPEYISFLILRKMKTMAEKYLGETVGKAVITVPAYFNNAQREATKKAGTEAGLNVIRLINEPTAAAIAYVKQKKLVMTEEMNLLFFDLGGGTFDVSIVTITEGGENIEVKAVDGDPHLGGMDFDNRIVDHCLEYYKTKHGIDLSHDKNILRKLRHACEDAKICLSNVYTDSAEVYVEYFYEGKPFNMELTKDNFEELIKDLVERCINMVTSCISESKVNVLCIDKFVLVGGSTRIPCIQEAMKKAFGDKVFLDIDVQEAVAIGATMMAAKLSIEDIAFQDFTLCDVTPLSLGVQVEGNVLDVVIPRNTSIPVKRSKIYTTTEDKQTSVDTIVYEGQTTVATENHKLGTFTMTGIPPAPRGEVEFEDLFSIDVDGILTVSSKVLLTGEKKQLIVTKEARLSTEVIDKMTRDGDKFKVSDERYKKASNELCSLIATMKDGTKSMPKGKKLNKIEDALSDVAKWLTENKDASGDELQAKKKSLETIFMQNK